MIERRKHPPGCLKEEEWREIHDFVSAAKEHRNAVVDGLEQTRKENKERFEILLAQLRATKADLDNDIVIVNGRITGVKTTAGRLIFWGVCSLITFAVAWGGVTSMAIDDNRKWHILEPEHEELVKNVAVLKEKPYGLRDMPVMMEKTQLK